MRVIEKWYLGIALKNRKRARVGPVEKLFLTKAGKDDAKVELPKEGVDGRWMTAFIQREIGSCRETIAKKLLVVQNKLFDHYANAMELVGKIQYVEKKAARVLEEIPEEPTDEELNCRRSGEEELTKEQVQKRRIREYEKQKLSLEEKADSILDEAADDVKKLIREESFISQVENLVDIYVARVTNHSRQRIDAYWNALYSYGTDKGRIPSYYQHEDEEASRVNFRDLHAKEHEKIAKLLEKYKEDAA